jgi:inhibitor of the pro-sigma K processing machinery
MALLRGLLANAIVGLVILFVANVIGLGVQISLLTLLICAILGVPGALVVIVLSVLGIAFTGTVAPLLLLLGLLA